MYSKEVHERSPLRVFEKSIHGGLGPGNLGVVMSRAGIGKTAFLIGVALDDLMQGRKVLHISFDDSVERIRDFYDVIFKELQKTTRMQDAAETFRCVERSRMIHVYARGELSVDRLAESVAFLGKHMNFEPRVLIMDGVDFRATSNEELAALKQLAETLKVEVWMSAQVHRADPPQPPVRVADHVVRFDRYISIFVLLHPEEEGSITVQLLKDHDNPDLTDLRMKLDPTTLLLLAE